MSAVRTQRCSGDSASAPPAAGSSAEAAPSNHVVPVPNASCGIAAPLASASVGICVMRSALSRFIATSSSAISVAAATKPLLYASVASVAGTPSSPAISPSSTPCELLSPLTSLMYSPSVLMAAAPRSTS